MVMKCGSSKANSPCCSSGACDNDNTSKKGVMGSNCRGYSSSLCGRAASSNSLVHQATDVNIKTSLSSSVESTNKLKSTTIPISPSIWKRGAHNVYDQYQDYSDESTEESHPFFCHQKVKGDANSTIPMDDNSSDDDENPWTYSGKRLQALQFPLGGFGAFLFSFMTASVPILCCTESIDC